MLSIKLNFKEVENYQQYYLYVYPKSYYFTKKDLSQTL